MATAFSSNFVRVEYGKWTCVTPAEYDGPGGLIQVAPGTTFTIGTRFAGLDIARMLEGETPQPEEDRSRDHPVFGRPRGNRA